jgi:hypothetical protein
MRRQKRAISHIDDAIVSLAKKTQASHDKSRDAMCPACAKLPWDQLIFTRDSPKLNFTASREPSKPYRISNARPINKFPTLSNYRSAHSIKERSDTLKTTLSCPTCQLLREVEYVHTASANQQASHIKFHWCDPQVVEAPGIGTLTLDWLHGVFDWAISLDTTPHLIATNLPIEEAQQRLSNLYPGKLDVRLLKRWIQDCASSHGELCAPASQQQVQGLRLIDCTRWEIVTAPENSRFVALSYVWGQLHVEVDPNGLLPEDLPRTISDSMRMTLDLGYEFLWVDRYVSLVSSQEFSASDTCSASTRTAFKTNMTRSCKWAPYTQRRI